MKCVPSWPVNPFVGGANGDGGVTVRPGVLGSSVPDRNTSSAVSTGGVTSIVTGTLALVSDPPEYARIAVTVAPPSASPVAPMLSVAANSGDPAGADPLPVPINTPAAFRTWNVTPVAPPGARAVAATWTRLPTNPFAAGLVTTIEAWFTGLQVTLCKSQDVVESQGGLQVAAMHTGGLCVLSQRAPVEQSASLPHWPCRSFCGRKQPAQSAKARATTSLDTRVIRAPVKT